MDRSQALREGRTAGWRDFSPTEPEGLKGGRSEVFREGRSEGWEDVRTYDGDFPDRALARPNRVEFFLHRIKK